MFNLHALIKFWARKEPRLIIHEMEGCKLIADPFCGSGSSGFGAVLVNASAFLSDVNPVSVFIAYNVLNDETLDTEVIETIKQVCYDIENEVYTLNGSKVSFAVWKSVYRCPFCSRAISLVPRRKTSCKNCGKTFLTKDVCVDEKLISLKFLAGRTSQSKKLINDYLSTEETLKIKFWYPQGKFVYPGTEIEFRNGPHKPIEIKDLFTKRNLYAVSKLYSHIEKIWKKNKSQGDLLKLVFIASLANATKMMPHSKTSGPSWKIPRYWIPSLREERNFCRSFLRRLSLLASFKEKWSPIISNYQITVSFNGKIESSEKNFIHLCRANALDIHSDLPKLDLIVFDPPHYDEINYFELTYLWQKWLEGRYRDDRFRDYDYWKNEICVNRTVGKDLQWYNAQLYEIVSRYISRLRKNGKIILILHNKDRDVLRRTVRGVKEVAAINFAIKTEYKFPKIPSSTQGLHGHKKYLCIVKMKRVN